MTKKELLEIIEEYPEDYEVLFTQEDELNRNEHSEMYLDNVTEAPGLDYVHLYFRYTR